MTEPTVTLGSQGQRQRHRRLEMFERGRDDRLRLTEVDTLYIYITSPMHAEPMHDEARDCQLESLYSILHLFLPSIAVSLQIDPARSCSMTFRVAVGKGWSWEGSGLGSRGHISTQQLLRVQIYPPLHILMFWPICEVRSQPFAHEHTIRIWISMLRYLLLIMEGNIDVHI